MEVVPDAQPGPVGPAVFFCYISLVGMLRNFKFMIWPCS